MFTVDALPASYGDCLWVEYGDPNNLHRILIDCGLTTTFPALKQRILDLPEGKRNFELLVISHIDNDHIQAAVRLLNAESLGVTFGDIWFNGWDQIHDRDVLGAVEGEKVSALITKRKLPHNKKFGAQAVVVPEEGALPSVSLPGGMKLTLLSPSPSQLTALRTEWVAQLKKKGLTPGDTAAALDALAEEKKYADELGAGVNVKKLAEAEFTEDPSSTNGSSIAFLAEYDHKRCLFAADAAPSQLASSLTRVLKRSGPKKLSLDLVKIPHHGSKHNTNADLLELLNCRSYLFSTDGKKFSHPNPEAVARVISYGGNGLELHFNYRSKFNAPWDDGDLMRKYGYEISLPAAGASGCAFTL